MIVFPLFSSNVQVNLHIYRLLESGRYDTQKDFTVKCHDNQHHHHHHRHRSSSPSSLLFSTMLIVQSSFIKVLFNRWWSSHPSSTARFPRSSTNSSKGGFIISTSFNFKYQQKKNRIIFIFVTITSSVRVHSSSMTCFWKSKWVGSLTTSWSSSTPLSFHYNMIFTILPSYYHHLH